MKLRMERFFRAISNSEGEEQTVGMQGKLDDYNLIDIVQTLEQNKKTGVLTMYHGRDEGRIWFKDGEIYDARFRNIEDINAILKLMTWMEGDFTMSFTQEDYERKIMVDNQQILLDAIQYLDERNQILQTLPDKDELLLISPDYCAIHPLRVIARPLVAVAISKPIVCKHSKSSVDSPQFFFIKL